MQGTNCIIKGLPSLSPSLFWIFWISSVSNIISSHGKKVATAKTASWTFNIEFCRKENANENLQIEPLEWSKIKVSHSCFLLSSLACKWPSSCCVYIWSSLCANIPLMYLFLMALVMNQYLSSFNSVTSLKAQSLNIAAL